MLKLVTLLRLAIYRHLYGPQRAMLKSGLKFERCSSSSQVKMVMIFFLLSSSFRFPVGVSTYLATYAAFFLPSCLHFDGPAAAGLYESDRNEVGQCTTTRPGLDWSRQKKEETANGERTSP